MNSNLGPYSQPQSSYNSPHSQNFRLGQHQPCHRQQESSELQIRRINNHKQIRDLQINKIKGEIRTQIQTNSFLESRLNGPLPISNLQARVWCDQLIESFKYPNTYRIAPRKAAQLFKFVEKFPNNSSLKLLVILISKADQEALQMIFQNDVMKFLHRQMSFGNPGENMEERRENSKDCMQIITEVCQKSVYTRNFAVVNYNTHKECYREHKFLGIEIRRQYLQFLESTTKYPFSQYQANFAKITKRILNFMIECKTMFCEGEQEQNSGEEIEILLRSLKNLVRMKMKFVMEIIDSPMHAESLFDMGLSIMETAIQLDRETQGARYAELLHSCLLLMINYLQVSQRQEGTPVSKYFGVLVHVLELCRRGELPLYPYLVVRKDIFFSLSNLFCEMEEDRTVDILHSMLKMNYGSNSNFQNGGIISLLAFYLQIQNNQHCLYQLCYCISILMKFIPSAKDINQQLKQSELIQIFFRRMSENLCHKDALKESGNVLFLKGLTLFIKKVMNWSIPEFKEWESILNSDRLMNIANSELCSKEEEAELSCLIDMITIAA